MMNDIDLISWSPSKLVEDDDLDEILQLADSIRAHPICDKLVDIDPALFDTLSTAPADLAAVDQHIAAVEAVANQSTGTHKFCDMLLDGDEGSLLAMLSECLTTNNNDFQPTETLTEISDSYINEKQPLLTQLNILQQFERAWPFADNKSSSCWSAPQEHVHDPSPFHWSQYSVSPSPSASSTSSSSSSSSPPSPSVLYPSFVYPGVVDHKANYQLGGTGLPFMSTPLRPSTQRLRSYSSSSSSDSGRPCPVKRRRTRAKANKMKVYHLWEFIHELLELSELQQQAMRRGCAVDEVAPVRWESKELGIFRIVDSKRMASLWGQHKRNSTMTYEKLSRSLRWCRSSGFLSEVPKNGAYPKKLCFRFGQRAADMYAARCQSRTC